MPSAYPDIHPSLLGAKAEASALYLRPGAETFSARAAKAVVAAASPTGNIVAVGVGEKVTKGIATGVRAVKVFVRVKFASEVLSDDERIAPAINGVPVDVEQIGTVRAFRAETQGVVMPNPRIRRRPAQPGCSIGFIDDELAMAGTFGALVKRGTKLFILSNNHVLANENQLPAGAAIAEPGTLDHGRTTDAIAKLAQFIELKLPPQMNRVDAALAEVTKPDAVSRDILFIGAPRTPAAARIDMIVQKFGRTTSYRAGRVISVATDVKVGYDIGELLFENQVIVQGLNGQAFSAAGDSGSLITERTTNRAVGLLFAGSSSHTIANHVEDVLAALRVRLA
ncbi:MAG: hypothetical protein JO197_21545 [Acidobacteria bacterium]|nr:hypothetical protein [Acidobacteriota bacterium]MBV9475474.1 hypothetical protein [Acidobacteriota bacterium]